MEAVIAKLEEQGTDEEVIASYQEQMTSAQRLHLENYGKTVNKYDDIDAQCFLFATLVFVWAQLLVGELVHDWLVDYYLWCYVCSVADNVKHITLHCC